MVFICFVSVSLNVLHLFVQMFDKMLRKCFGFVSKAVEVFQRVSVFEVGFFFKAKSSCLPVVHGIVFVGDNSNLPVS